MLELRNICKQYKTGDLVQQALDNVSLSFRDCEFVAVLGPSGSGKTTLLNMIGGLDRYDSGDMLINGVSTKAYKDRDWDTYRNHSVGFVFQSYNLISHQSVLSNVELALTLSGVSRSERRKRALAALEKVGLAEHRNKRPNQLSGGQMQRVAIARALVNDPEILLADEPTGALDSETGIQVMELLKEVAQDRLVIMVTHNAELAHQYATRIVGLSDGAITSDSDPLVVEEEPAEKEPEHVRKSSMSFLTALGLSFNNLLTKKGRTILIAFGGSIGIIGIALILSLSSGVNNYIDDLQRSTMASYPVTISSSTMDLTSMFSSVSSEFMNGPGEEPAEAREDGVYSDSRALVFQETITSSVVENDLTAFKAYLDDPDSEINKYIGENGVVYGYDTKFDVYVRDEGGSPQNTSRDLDDSDSGGGLMSFSSGGSMMSMLTGSGGDEGAVNFSELLPGSGDNLISEVVTDSYDVISGRWPESMDEVVLVVDDDNSVDTSVLCQLGLVTEDWYKETRDKIEDGDSEPAEQFLNYDEVLGTKYLLVTFSDYYVQDEKGIFYNVSDTVNGLNDLMDEALELSIVGVVRANDDAATSISTAIGYTSALTEYIINHSDESAVIQAQEADPEINVLTGWAFEAEDDAAKEEDAKEYLSSLGVSEKATMYQMMLYYSSVYMDQAADEAAGEENTDYTNDETAATIAANMNEAAAAGLADAAEMDEAAMAEALDTWLAGDPDPQFLLMVYEQYIGAGDYEDNLSDFGKVSFDAPSSISIYSDTFEDKDKMEECITEYNRSVDEDSQITYTDYIAILTSSITTMVNVVTYVLIAFVAVSLIVSCIMIAIITHISVMERTREIGILRALGASKGNISEVFNAETFIIGLCAGVVGVGISELLIIPINALVHTLTGDSTINAVLPWSSALILILISIVITLLSGLIPARNAARKDPVTALRSE
ncbi:MAG: ABC transporter ATP-binding protein/permease [Oscillospiraceae bacterium]|nr:ABC transporter ATP-binding protein/permease [Oscillospiraceae bacterium]